MRQAALAHLHVTACRDEAVKNLCHRTRIGTLDLELPRPETSVRWAGTAHAARRTGWWRRGRANGRATVDLLVAGNRRTLLSLRLEQPSGWFAAPVTEDDARSVARHLRDIIEGQGEPETAEVTVPELIIRPGLGYSSP